MSVPRGTIIAPRILPFPVFHVKQPPSGKARSHPDFQRLILAQHPGRILPRWERAPNRALDCGVGAVCRPLVPVVTACKFDLFRGQIADPRKTHSSICCPETAHPNHASQGCVGCRFGCRSARNSTGNNPSADPLPTDRKQAEEGLIPAGGHSPSVTEQHLGSARKTRTGKPRSGGSPYGRCGAIPSGVKSWSAALPGKNKNAASCGPSLDSSAFGTCIPW